MTASLSTEGGLSGLPDHLHGFALTHMAMRRDARRLVAATPAALDRPAVADWWDHLRRTIEWHHHSEDDLLWPELRRAVPDVAGAETVLDDDHAELDAAMAAVTAALAPGGSGPDRAAAARRFDALIHDHLRREETVVFPAFLAMGRDRYEAVERRVIGSLSPGLLTFVLPWMFDGFGRRETGRADATIPPPVRLVAGTVLRRRYERRWRRW